MPKPTRKKQTPKSLEDSQFLIDNILLFGTGTPINIVAAIFGAIEGARRDIRPGLLRLAAERFGFVDSANKREVPDVISDAERDRLTTKFGKTVNAMLEALIQANLEEDAFYHGLYTLIENPFFAEPKAKIFALYYALIDKRVPYFHLEEGLRMSDEEFEQRLVQLQSPRMRINFVLARHFAQKTEEADILLRLLSAQEERDRIVLLADALYTLRIQRIELLQQLKSMRR